MDGALFPSKQHLGPAVIKHTYLRLTRNFCAPGSGAKHALKNWAGRAQILVSENQEAARCPVFLGGKRLLLLLEPAKKIISAFASSDETLALKVLLVRVATPLKSSGQE